MRVTSPTLDEKLRYHRMRKEGKFEPGHAGWVLYEEMRDMERKVEASAKAAQARRDSPEISMDDYEPGTNPPRTNPHKELGF